MKHLYILNKKEKEKRIVRILNYFSLILHRHGMRRKTLSSYAYESIRFVLSPNLLMKFYVKS